MSGNVTLSLLVISFVHLKINFGGRLKASLPMTWWVFNILGVWCRLFFSRFCVKWVVLSRGCHLAVQFACVKLRRILFFLIEQHKNDTSHHSFLSLFLKHKHNFLSIKWIIISIWMTLMFFLLQPSRMLLMTLRFALTQVVFQNI